MSGAVSLARAGRYEEAEEALHALGGRSSDDPAVLDLLARIHAQRGELFEADECWALALRLDGDYTPARAGRRRIATLSTRTPRGGRVALAVALAAAAVAGAGLVLTPAPEPDPAVLAALADVRGDQRAQAERLDDRLDDLDARLDQDVLWRQQVLADVVAALGPALLVRTGDDAVEIVFPAGVFRTGIRLTDDGSVALADVARRLAPFARDVSITVVGHTDDTPVPRNGRYATNAELGLARAVVAAEQLSAASGLPLSAFALSSAGAGDPPFPGTTAESRARNRTVTVVVRPR